MKKNNKIIVILLIISLAIIIFFLIISSESGNSQKFTIRVSVKSVPEEIDGKMFYFRIYNQGEEVINKNNAINFGAHPLFKPPKGSMSEIKSLETGKYFIAGFIDINNNTITDMNNPDAFNYDLKDKILNLYNFDLTNDLNIEIPFIEFKYVE